MYETVNANSLSAFVNEQITENDESLPEWLEGLVNVFEQTRVSVRKAAAQVKRKDEFTMSKNTEITTTNNAGYLALKDFNLSDVMAEEMSGLSASFERIKIPSGAAPSLRFRAMIPMSRRP